MIKRLILSVFTVAAIALSTVAVAQAADGGYYDLTKSANDKSKKTGFFAGATIQALQVDYNSDDPDNSSQNKKFADDFNGFGALAGFGFESGTKIEINLFRQKDEDREHLFKVRSFDVLLPILTDKVEGALLDLGVSYIVSSMKKNDFYQRALGFNIGLAYEFPVYDNFKLRAATKAVIVDETDDIGIDNIYSYGLALLYYF